MIYLYLFSIIFLFSFPYSIDDEVPDRKPLRFRMFTLNLILTKVWLRIVLKHLIRSNENRHVTFVKRTLTTVTTVYSVFGTELLVLTTDSRCLALVTTVFSW